MERL
ncbi:hypothetical protein LINGRAHAP2_LOCUS3331 [Linum grandiflorum]|jgi:hypothetical protein